MKGKQLTLDEVLKLDDGTVIWVEDDDEGDKQTGTVKIEESVRVCIDGNYDYFEIEELKNYNEYVKFYEWVNIDEIMESKELPYQNITQQPIYNMSVEICNLRGINLTNDNIDKVMKEFA